MTACFVQGEAGFPPGDCHVPEENTPVASQDLLWSSEMESIGQERVCGLCLSHFLECWFTEQPFAEYRPILRSKTFKFLLKYVYFMENSVMNTSLKVPLLSSEGDDIVVKLICSKNHCSKIYLFFYT